MVELSELSYYRYYRITVCYLIGRRSGHRNMVELSPSVELGLVQNISVNTSSISSESRPNILGTTEGELVYQLNVKLLTCINPNTSSIFLTTTQEKKNYTCSFFKI
ncbi:hypothetical protein LAZ67_3006270 [Cordylochernes scorpioides]|uniref:Uncharacterized protein n=1 Tax=Cordylochernes scorpioides TaxID=51811 RepID=A0ABY6KE33_9ARAC|nr:hypothetical protein LAZ67_3006270 [Cordylochernes scorpioides]